MHVGSKVISTNMASPAATKPPDQKSLHEDEVVSQTSSDPLIVIYQNIASRDGEWKAQQTKRLLRKVDVRLLPLLVLMYLLNFLDRSNLAQARLGTLEIDLGMKGTDFNLATSILFVVCLKLLFQNLRSICKSKCLCCYRDISVCSYQPICYSQE